jgi:predicted nicotinamide N-methyase
MSEVLRTSLLEQLAGLGRPDPSPPALEVALQQVALPGGEVTVLKPRDWSALHDAEGLAARPTPFWALVWPSGHALGRAVARAEVDGLRVLELGCGLGVPSLAAARGGAEVLATDGTPEAVAFTAHSLALNALAGEVALVSWREARALEELGDRWDLVLASDVLYQRAGVEALLRLLPRVLAPDGEVWVADPGRAGAQDFLELAMREWRRESERDREDDRVRLHRLRRR